MPRSSLTFGSGSGAWQRAPTRDLKEHPLKAWRRDYLAGFTQAARDIAAGTPRGSFGSFAATAYAAGYRDGVQEAGGK